MPPPAPPRNLPLTERLRPARLDELLGNARARAELKAWGASWSKGPGPPARRAAVLSGPPGVGKTSAALALAADLGWGVVEMNASDARNAAAVERVAGRAASSHSLLAGPQREGGRARTLILLDEADCLTSRLGDEARAPPPPTTLRTYLEGRYGEIASLNAAWGLGRAGAPPPFEAWEAVPRSPGNHRWAQLPPAERDIADWRSSNAPSDLSDRGGLGAMARLVRETSQPIVLTVNDEEALTRPAPVFRTGVLRIRFRPLEDEEVRVALARIARREGFAVDPSALEAIVGRARGDFRAALNDLEAIAPLPAGALERGLLATRDLTGDLVALTEEALASARFYSSNEVRDRTDATPDDLFPWIEENAPRFAEDAAHRAAAFGPLGRAERMLGRARRQRVWTQWSYASETMTGGVGVRLRERGGPPGRAMFPQFLGEMGRARAARAVRDAIAAKLGRFEHRSRAKTRESGFVLLESLLAPAAAGPSGRGARDRQRALLRALALTPEEVAFLRREEPGSPEIDRLFSEEEPEAAPPPSERPRGQSRLDQY